MANQQQAQQGQEQEQEQRDQQNAQAATGQQPPERPRDDSVDGLKDKKPEELTPEELRLMADTMPGEGPGD